MKPNMTQFFAGGVLRKGPSPNPIDTTTIIVNPTTGGHEMANVKAKKKNPLYGRVGNKKRGKNPGKKAKKEDKLSPSEAKSVEKIVKKEIKKAKAAPKKAVSKKSPKARSKPRSLGEYKRIRGFSSAHVKKILKQQSDQSSYVKRANEEIKKALKDLGLVGKPPTSWTKEERSLMKGLYATRKKAKKSQLKRATIGIYKHKTESGKRAYRIGNPSQLDVETALMQAGATAAGFMVSGLIDGLTRALLSPPVGQTVKKNLSDRLAQWMAGTGKAVEAKHAAQGKAILSGSTFGLLTALTMYYDNAWLSRHRGAIIGGSGAKFIQDLFGLLEPKAPTDFSAYLREWAGLSALPGTVVACPVASSPKIEEVVHDATANRLKNGEAFVTIKWLDNGLATNSVTGALLVDLNTKALINKTTAPAGLAAYENWELLSMSGSDRLRLPYEARTVGEFQDWQAVNGPTLPYEVSPALGEFQDWEPAGTTVGEMQVWQADGVHSLNGPFESPFQQPF